MTRKAGPRLIQSDADLRTAAHHVGYEIEMLMYSGEYIGWGHSSPPSTPTGNDRNMALESFLLHFRNLRAFLCPSLQTVSSDDILASDYLNRTDPEDIGDPQRFHAAEKARLDKMLAHLSYTRAKYISSDDHFWPGALMTKSIIEEFIKFVPLLPDARKGWFPSLATLAQYKAQAVGMMADASPASQGWYSARYPE